MVARQPDTPTRAFDGDPPHVLIVEARFYEELADALLAGAQRALESAGATHDHVTVPGALEIPAALAMALDAMDEGTAAFDGFVVLGCVIRGDTAHFDVVARESNRAVMDLTVNEAIPLGNGILTVESDAQAWERANAGKLDKGGAAARACLDMIRLKRRFGS